MEGLSRSEIAVDGEKLPILYQLNRSEKIIWPGPKDMNDTGFFKVEGFQSFLAFEIPVLPDFSSSRFQDLCKLQEEERLQNVIHRQTGFLSSLHDICYRTNTALAIRYLYWPDKYRQKVRIFIHANTFYNEASYIKKYAEQIFKEIKANFPYEFYKTTEVQTETMEELLNFSWVSHITEIIKKENIYQPFYPKLSPAPFWYYPGFFKSRFDSLSSLFETILSQNNRVLIDLTLVPTKISPFEKQIIQPLILELEKWGKGYVLEEEKLAYDYQVKSLVDIDFQDYSRRRRSERLEPDINAEAAAKTYAQILESYNQSQIFIYGIRILTDSERSNITVRDKLAACVFNGPSDKIELTQNHKFFNNILESIRTGSISPLASRFEFWEHEKAPRKLMRLHRLVDLKEAVTFFHLPIPSYGGIAGVELDSGLRPQEKASPDQLIKIKLGHFARHGIRTEEIAGFPLSALTKHGLIVGMPGSGKTTTCFHLLDQLWRNYNIPFIAIEPAKTEYRALKTIAGLEEILVFTVGDERTSPFRFNPFEVLEGVELERHISNLNNSFSGAWDLIGPLPNFFENAIQEIYYDKGWTDIDIGGIDDSLEFPTMDDFYEKVTELIEKAGYDSELTNNLKTAGSVRIDSFRRGSKGRMLNTKKSIPAKVLMNMPIILELDSLNEEDRALITMFILTMVREYATAQRKSGSSLKHVLLIEEAHNIIGNISAGRASDTVNPKVKAINYFVAMLAEMRALGEGIIIADQLPSALAPEAIKNTNIKIMHHLTSEDDRQTLGISMTISAEQFSQTALLSPGESFIFMEGWPNSRHVLEPNYKDDHNVSEPPGKQEIQQLMQSFHKENALIYMPFDHCSSICSQCDQRTRIKAERFIMTNSSKIFEILETLKNRDADSINKAVICPFLLYIVHEMPDESSIFYFCAYCHFINTRNEAYKLCKRSFQCSCPINKTQFAKQLLEIKLKRKISI